MEVFQINFLRLMTVFMYNFYMNCAKICIFPQVQSIAKGIKVETKEHFWSAIGIIMVLFDINCLCLLVPKLNVLPNGVYFNLSDYYVPTGIYDIFKLILSILFLHYYLKYFMYIREWKSYKWLENVIIVGSYIGVFTIALILSCIGLIIVPSTTFEKIKFVILLVVSYLAYYTACTTNWFDKYIYSVCYTYTTFEKIKFVNLLVVSYFAYYTACTTDWFDKYIYSVCYTYTSTVNHNVLKDRQYLIVSNLATRWHTKNVKKIAQKEKKTVQSAPQDPRLNRHVLVNKGLNNIHSQFTSLEKTVQSAPQDPRLNRHVLVNKGINNIHSQFTSLDTSESPDGEYLISTRIVRPDSYYHQSDNSAWGKSELKEYPNKLCQ